MKITSFYAGEGLVTCYLHESHPRIVTHISRPALIICPGGGYNFVCPRESDPPALQFFADGFQVFVLTYSTGKEAAALKPLRELAEAVQIIREKSVEWHIDPEKIAAMGFSAGGHLAASLGALWNRKDVKLPGNCRPDALVLCYPVITMGELTHPLTAQNVSGGNTALNELLSIENQITNTMPPTFLWHTVEDGSVPVENALMLACALRRTGVPFECHLFQSGQHGLSICTREVETPSKECHEWIHLAKNWLYKIFLYEP